MVEVISIVLMALRFRLTVQSTMAHQHRTRGVHGVLFPQEITDENDLTCVGSVGVSPSQWRMLWVWNVTTLRLISHPVFNLLLQLLYGTAVRYFYQSNFRTRIVYNITTEASPFLILRSTIRRSFASSCIIKMLLNLNVKQRTPAFCLSETVEEKCLEQFL